MAPSGFVTRSPLLYRLGSRGSCRRATDHGVIAVGRMPRPQTAVRPEDLARDAAATGVLRVDLVEVPPALHRPRPWQRGERPLLDVPVRSAVSDGARRAGRRGDLVRDAVRGGARLGLRGWRGRHR